ncbi:MAG: cbb3-type cytochrome c oxidase subunit I [Planctomycetes bacterium]|nr:cbb3-type cytochrome c oxidase subunit I [Planctomycetota bacterium]
MLFFGGLLALAIRWQLAWPWTEMPIVGGLVLGESGRVLSPAGYTALFTMHGTAMVFFAIIPLLTGAFGNYLVPLLVGAPDMAFPRLNAASFWIFAASIVLFFAGFGVEGGAANSGWTAYPPLATVPAAAPGSGAGQTWWLVAITVLGVSTILNALNAVVTIVKMRAPGLTWMRLPLTAWGLLVAAALQLSALPVLTAAGLLQLADRLLGTAFYTPAGLYVNAVQPDVAAGGSPLLWQHLFWFYSHPAVYVMVLPAMGFVSDILSVNARKPVFGYKPMVAAIGAIAGLGLLVWGHHMFTSGLGFEMGRAFMLSTMLIALPSAVKTFNWIATIWGGRIRLTAAMCFALGFVALFVIGGLSGLWLAATPVDVYLHDTYLVVAHFHYIVFGGTVLAVFAALHHWWPKITGRALSETLGRWHFLGTFVALNCVFLPMHQLGIAGMIRRTADPSVYQLFDRLEPLNRFVTWSAFGLMGWQLLFVANVVWSFLGGVRVGRNPWEAASLEWETPSPPAHGNFDSDLVIERGPYEYGDAAGERDFAPQARRTAPREA